MFLTFFFAVTWLSWHEGWFFLRFFFIPMAQMAPMDESVLQFSFP